MILEWFRIANPLWGSSAVARMPRDFLGVLFLLVIGMNRGRGDEPRVWTARLLELGGIPAATTRLLTQYVWRALGLVILGRRRRRRMGKPLKPILCRIAHSRLFRNSIAKRRLNASWREIILYQLVRTQWKEENYFKLDNHFRVCSRIIKIITTQGEVFTQGIEIL